MRYAIIETGTVKNIVEATPEYAQSKGWIPAEANGTVAQIGGEWDGTQFHPAPPEPEPVPQSCTRRQGRLALLGVGKLDLVESAIAAIEDPTERMAAQIEYEADTWERGNTFLQAMWAQLGGTEQELDDLFREAVTL